jgi:RimJ/RimL family protein N-acetyltransferase
LETFDVISFALLGEQEKLIRSILWYGFRASGQAIVKFDIMDPLSLQILQKQTFKPLPENYQIVPWSDEYSGGVANVIYQSFKNSTDAYWDPRFRSEMGARKVVSMIRYGLMGTLCEEATSILLKDNEAVGVCYLVQDTMTEGNIPIIGVIPDEKKHDFGNNLLQQTLAKAIQGILDGKLGMLSVNATHDTDNIAAIKMYRRMGFREDYNYPHVYLTTDKLRTIKLGKWC